MMKELIVDGSYFYGTGAVCPVISRITYSPDRVHSGRGSRVALYIAPDNS